MYPSYPPAKARQLAVLLRISTDFDIVGDLSVTVANPSELLAWSDLLTDPLILAWRSIDSGHRFIHASASHQHPPVRGLITATLHAEQHREFWNELFTKDGDLEPGSEKKLQRSDLVKAWEVMPIVPPEH